MFKTEIIGIVNNVWPTILFLTVIIISLRIAYLLRTKKEFIFYKDVLMLGFIIYILSLYYVVTYQNCFYFSTTFYHQKEVLSMSFDLIHHFYTPII